MIDLNYKLIIAFSRPNSHAKEIYTYKNYIIILPLVPIFFNIIFPKFYNLLVLFI